jgi:hypothetical protein
MHRQMSQPTKQLMTRLALTGNTHIIHGHFLFCYTKIKSGRREYKACMHACIEKRIGGAPNWIFYMYSPVKECRFGLVFSQNILCLTKFIEHISMFFMSS